MGDASPSRRERPGPIAQQRARNARLRAQAEQLAERHAATVESEAVPRIVAVLPANTRNTTPLPEASREVFLARLGEVIDRVFRHPVRENAAPMSEEDRASRQDAQDARADGEPAGWPDYGPELTALQGASCGTCRGECCTAGGTHAFLRDDSITRVRAQLTEDGAAPSAESMLAIYREHLPARHYRDSCIYHTTSGCALPRSLRSNLCNRYVCGALTQLTRTLAASGQREAYVAAADSVHLRRMAVVSPHDARALSLRGT